MNSGIRPAKNVLLVLQDVTNAKTPKLVKCAPNSHSNAKVDSDTIRTPFQQINAKLALKRIVKSVIPMPKNAINVSLATINKKTVPVNFRLRLTRLHVLKDNSKIPLPKNAQTAQLVAPNALMLKPAFNVFQVLPRLEMYVLSLAHLHVMRPMQVSSSAVTKRLIKMLLQKLVLLVGNTTVSH